MSVVAAPQVGASGNLFLDSMGAGSAARIFPHLDSLYGSLGTQISNPEVPLEYVWFPVSGVISAVTRMQDGSDVETMLVGREGFYGVHLALGSDKAVNAAMVQLPDTLLRMPSETFKQILSEDPELYQRVLRYAQLTIETIGQFAGCNRLHPVNERCARWLLMAHDRVVGDELLLTQEYLATMLGVRRPGVSVAAGALDQAGAIEYHRGRIRILDRSALESMACECYAVTNDAMQRLLGYSSRKAGP
jgi:CRP-like cAMP-binding protein